MSNKALENLPAENVEKKKVIGISEVAHNVAKTAALVAKENLNEYVSALILKNAPRYDLKPQNKA